MLGNNADAFFTTPMRHSLVRGGNVGNQAPMPSPRDVNSSATGVVITRASGDFMPGIGDPQPIALADDAAAAAAAAPSQNTILAALASPIGLGLLAGFLFLTPMGKGVRRSIGLG